jgi:hypothetical protein
LKDTWVEEVEEGADTEASLLSRFMTSEGQRSSFTFHKSPYANRNRGLHCMKCPDFLYFS